MTTATHDYDLVAYSAAWENFLLRLHAGDTAFSFEVVRPFLAQLRSLSIAIAGRTEKIAQECINGSADEPLRNALQNEKEAIEKKIDFDVQTSIEMDIDANAIVRRYRNAAAVLHENGRSESAISALTILEPYLAGAVGDLIALISGHQEKAEFLTKMLDKFPHVDELATPGIINIFYQISDARLSSRGSWPLEQTISDLNYVISGAQLMKSRSADWLAKHKDDPRKATEIFDTFLRNELIGLTTKLQVFNARSLANESVSEPLRQEWVHALSRLIAMMRTRSGGPMVTSDTLPAAVLDPTTSSHLPKAKIELDIMLDAELAVSLSIILIEGSRSNASALACNTALYYIHQGRRKISAVVSEYTEDKADVRPSEMRWEQLVAVIAQRVGNSCDWKYESNRPSEQKP